MHNNTDKPNLSTRANTDSTLQKTRYEIDKIDSQILSLIEEREQLVQIISKTKKAASKKPIYHDPEREQAIIARVKKNYKGSFPINDIVNIFKCIIKNSRLLQEKSD